MSDKVCVVISGPAGSGKSLMGKQVRALAERLGLDTHVCELQEAPVALRDEKHASVVRDVLARLEAAWRAWAPPRDLTQGDRDLAVALRLVFGDLARPGALRGDPARVRQIREELDMERDVERVLEVFRDVGDARTAARALVCERRDREREVTATLDQLRDALRREQRAVRAALGLPADAALLAVDNHVRLLVAEVEQRRVAMARAGVDPDE